MKVYGTYNNTLQRDEKTGRTTFTIKTDSSLADLKYGTLICEGIIPLYPLGYPVELSGEMKEKHFEVEECIAKSSGRATTVSFLANGAFTGVGEKTAEAIVSLIGDDIFTFVKEENAVERLSEIPGFAVSSAKALVERVKGLIHLQSIVDFVTSYGGNYYQAVELYEKYGEKSIEVATKNPYVLTYVGFPFAMCEALGKENEIDYFDERRVKALVTYCIDQVVRQGNTRISFKELCKIIWSVEKRANMGYETNNVFIASALCSPEFKTETTNGKLYIYRTEEYEAECSIAKDVKRLNRSAKFYNYSHTPEDIEKALGISYHEKQKEAFQMKNSGGVKCTTGGPGTGKTTTMNGIIRSIELDHPYAKIVLCAPTGCAAKRMKEATAHEASTIHSLLNISAYDASTCLYDEYNQMDADFLFVDETTMADTVLMAKLLKAVKNGACVMLFGDVEQLSSVGAGNVFSDLISSGAMETHILERVYRQKDGGSILDNAMKIKDGNAELINDKTFEIHRFFNAEDMTDFAIRIAGNVYRDGQYNKIKVFSPVRKRKYAAGTVNLNRKLKAIINPADKNDYMTNGTRISLGDLVMFTRNNSAKGYFNGDDGVVVDIQVHGFKKYMTIELDNGERVSVAGTETDDVELNYATTAHKSQGSECDIAIILVPKEPVVLLERSLLYVEVTRAKKKVIMLVEDDALDIAVKNERSKERNTGLKDKLAA